VSNTPVELKTKATKQFQADLKKYAHYTGVPDYGQYTGYITADLAIKGLELAGKNPTRQGFIDAIRNNGKYDGAGLLCEPVDLSLEAFGKFPKTNCSWFANVKDGKFVFLNSGKPITGELIGDPAALAANASGTASATTTTAAAP
jgi:branched-chain amino acid transport system substrate-binding protein